ncbi:MAG TPA: response regulator transcription factor [Vicinamibacteria bacterium]|nr:response regulator transcription factor [Vicinamibacteria bacterium]
MARALVVEDDSDIATLITHYLERDGWRCDVARDGLDALSKLGAETYRLVVLDIQLPGRDGLSVLTQIRATPRLKGLPVVIVTARGEETDRIVGLEIGADDYIVKPFSPKEFAARVKAILRRIDRSGEAEDAIAIGPVHIDRARHTVTENGKTVHLTAKEFSLLIALADARGRVLSRDRLLEDIWGYSYIEGMRTIDVHVRRLREKLPAIAARIASVKPIGYRLADAGEGE